MAVDFSRLGRVLRARMLPQFIHPPSVKSSRFCKCHHTLGALDSIGEASFNISTQGGLF